MALIGTHDKRTSQRLEGISLPVEYLLKKTDEPFKEGKALGLGESGLMLTLKETLRLGSNLHLKLHIPIPSLSSTKWRTIPIGAKIIWVDDLQQSNRNRRYGTLFTEMSEKDITSIKQYMRLAQWQNDKVRDQ